ncbi:hypothetical protein WKH56_20575 [Priestia sp. SB1]|uniref:hypothetical protein n=1 Tax=Priestia sp. SB1 TaxID=3132359 RepID=UPI00316E18C8
MKIEINMTNEIATKVNELASQVIPSEFLNSFLDLDLEARLVGIQTFAAMNKDNEMIAFCQKALKYIKEN